MRYKGNKADGIHRPQVVLRHRVPQTAESNGLAVVHVALGRVVPQDAVDHNGHLPVGKPSVGAEPGLCLHYGRGHVEEGGDANAQGDETFNEKQPPPAGPSVDAAEMEDGKGQERGNNGCQRQSRPEEAVDR